MALYHIVSYSFGSIISRPWANFIIAKKEKMWSCFHLPPKMIVSMKFSIGIFCVFLILIVLTADFWRGSHWRSRGPWRRCFSSCQSLHLIVGTSGTLGTDDRFQRIEDLPTRRRWSWRIVGERKFYDVISRWIRLLAGRERRSETGRSGENLRNSNSLSRDGSRGWSTADSTTAAATTAGDGGGGSRRL